MTPEALSQLAPQAFEPFSCPSCGHTDQVYGPASKQSLQCSECGARIAYGILQPRVTVQPHTDRRFCHVRLDTTIKGETTSVNLVLLNEFAHEIAKNVASITKAAK
jgi:ribosomal protein L37AE/L43A